MRTISSIRTAAPVAAFAATACSQRAEPRQPPSQDQATMKAKGPDDGLPVIDRHTGFAGAGAGRRNPPRMAAPGAERFATGLDSRRILGAVPGGAELEGRPS